MTVSTRTVTAVAVLTNPFVWLALVLAIAVGVMYVLYAYVRHELSAPDRPIRLAPPWALSPTPECGKTTSADKVLPRGGQPAPNLLLTAESAADKGAKNVRKAATRKPKAAQPSSAKEAKQNVARTPRKAAKKPAAKAKKSRP